MNKRQRWIAGLGGLAVAAIVAILIWKPWTGEAVALSREAAERAVLARYPGIVSETTKSGGVYRMRLQTDRGLYEVEADAYSGEIVYLQLIEAAAAEPSPSGGTEQSPPASGSEAATPPPAGGGNGTATAAPGGSAPPPPPPASGGQTEAPGESAGEPPALLAPAKAKSLAAAHVAGEIEDAELKRTADGGAYYLVEIDVDDGRDAIVQVHAISGAIMSVTWDDENDSDDDADDDDDA
ncbi:PepSY domain-containing protein [Cohnella massiliensis]|uniref:PepSY domain-containing protein n=1 Tax=Cohnella massiliensis TaxID=1816691 RepID=UPI00159336D7|nr:PepSY domain-containing protein [Cohnella massiliensis]